MLDKQLIYLFHQSLRRHLPELRLGQSREIVAAYFGFKTVASLSKAGFVIPEYSFDSLDDDFDDDQQPSTQLSPQVETEIRHRLRKLSKDVLSNSQLEEQVISHIKEDAYLKQCDFYCWNDIAPWMVDILGYDLLDKLSAEGNTSAAYTCAIHYFDENYLDDEGEPHEDYWYKRYASGEPLEGGALRFAKEYEEKLLAQNQYKLLLERAAKLGSVEAKMELAEYTDDVATIKYLATQGYYPAVESLYETYGESEYEEMLALRGHKGAIYHLMGQYENSVKEDEQYKIVFLNELANLYGYYPTRSIADNDEDYGPVFVLYEGIRLPQLSEDLKLKAKAEAQKAFHHHQ